MPINLMYFLIADSSGKKEFTSRNLEPNPDSTRRAGLLAAIGGPVGLVLGLRNVRNDAEAAAAAAATTGGGTVSPPTGTATPTEFVIPDVTKVPFDEAEKKLGADRGKFKAKEILVTNLAAKEPPVVVTQDPVAGQSRPQGATVDLRVHVKPASDPTTAFDELASTLRKAADELTAGKS